MTKQELFEFIKLSVKAKEKDNYMSSKYNFAGREKEFAKFIDAWTRVYDDFTTNYRGGGYFVSAGDYEAQPYIDILKNVFAVNCNSPLDWNKVFENLKVDLYRDSNEFVFEHIVSKISEGTFKEVVNKCNNHQIAYLFYRMQGRCKKYSDTRISSRYAKYLDQYFERNKKESPEGMLNYYLTSPALGDYTDKHVLIPILMKKANLDTELYDELYYGENEYGKKECKYHHFEKKESLKSKIACSIVLFPDLNKEEIELFLKVNKDMYFKTNIRIYDRCQLYFCADNKEAAMKVFNSKEYELYDEKQYNALKNNYSYDIADLGSPVDRLKGLLNYYLDIDAESLTKILYSGKIKMIDADDLGFIKQKLGEEEYKKFMGYVANSNIIIYYIYGKEQVMVSDNLGETLAYLRYKKQKRRAKIIM